MSEQPRWTPGMTEDEVKAYAAKRCDSARSTGYWNGVHEYGAVIGLPVLPQNEKTETVFDANAWRSRIEAADACIVSARGERYWLANDGRGNPVPFGFLSDADQAFFRWRSAYATGQHYGQCATRGVNWFFECPRCGDKSFYTQRGRTCHKCQTRFDQDFNIVETAAPDADPFQNAGGNVPIHFKIERGEAKPTSPTPGAPLARADLLQMHRELCEKARRIMEAKNTDYAGGGDDIFGNFRAAEFFGVAPEIGLMMRMMDKMKRMESFVQTGALAVKDEPVDDIITDLINYTVLMAGLVAERRARSTPDA